MSQAGITVDKATVELNRIVELFSSKELPALISKVFFAPNHKPSSNWSLGNKLIMLSHDTTDARTFNQWRQIGRFVKKGTKGFWILAPNTFTIKRIDEKTKQETSVRIMKGFRVSQYAEFRAEDTEGKEIETVKDQPKTFPPLAEVAQKLGATIKYDVTSHGEHGSFNPSTQVIRLCTKDQTTFFHELAHLAHKKIDGKLQGGQIPEHEIIAELSSCVLASLYGFNIEAESWTYIKTYTKDQTIEGIGKACMQVLSKVEKILTLILSTSENKEVS
jgi:antirestriction protein ArdC